MNVVDVPSKPRTWSSILLGQLAAFAVFVGVPALVTAIAPVSWIRFTRQGDTVTADVDVCCLFIVPYRRLKVAPVVEIDDQKRSGEWHYDANRKTSTRGEDTAQLLIRGPDQEASVEVTPFNIEKVKSRAQVFLKDPQANELKMFVVANWKFSAIMGGAVSSLTLLYVLGVTLGFLSWLKKLAGFSRPAQVPA